MSYDFDADFKNLLLSLSKHINDDPINDANDNLKNEYLVFTLPNNAKDYTKLIREYSTDIQDEVDGNISDFQKKSDSSIDDDSQLQFYMCEYPAIQKRSDDYKYYVMIIPENLEKLSKEEFKVSSAQLFEQATEFLNANNLRNIAEPENQEIKIIYSNDL
jgi:hypothetical protein